MRIVAVIWFCRSVVLLAVGVLVVPCAGEAQQAARQVKIGVLCAGLCPFGGSMGAIEPLTTALERVGLVRGRTLAWDTFGVVRSEDQIAVEAQKLVSRRPDLILVWPGSVRAARAAKDATGTIPIVLMAVPDAVEHALVESLGRPGGNISGTSIPLYALTLKQIEVLKEINQRLKGIIVVDGDLDRGERKMLDRLREAAASPRLDAGISVADVRNYEQVLAAAPPGTSSVVVFGNIHNNLNSRRRDLALERKLPLIMPWREWGGGGSGTLIAYGPRFPAVAERTAALIDRIVKGARPRDLPVEAPTSYELIIDGVITKALGLTIPPKVRARADDVLDSHVAHDQGFCVSGRYGRSLNDPRRRTSRCSGPGLALLAPRPLSATSGIHED
jgi:putative ABC transport system substrate-binding protein